MSLFPNADIVVLTKVAEAGPLIFFSLSGVLAFQSIENHPVKVWMVMAPTAGLNAIVWSQADTVITAFLFLSFATLQRDRLWGAILLFAIALSTKLISIFFAPYLLFCLMQRRDFRHVTAFVPLVVFTYFAANLPYLLAGVSVLDTLTIY